MSDVAQAPVQPVHDRPTLVSYAALATWSWFVYGLGATLAFLHDEQASATWLQGFHGTSLAAGGIIGALLAPRFINRFGRGPVMRAGVVGTAICVVLFVAPVPSAIWTLSWVFVACFFGNLIVVCVNAFIATHQGSASPAAFTESTGLAELMGLLAPLVIGAEFCISLWGASLLRERTGLSTAAAAAGLGAFLGGVFIGRAFGSGLARRVASEKLLRASMTAGLVTFAFMWLAGSATWLLVAFFATGLALSLTWPLSMSRILRSAGGRTDRASSLALACTTTAIGVAPFALGGLAGGMPVHQAFLLVPVLIGVALVLVITHPVPEDAPPPLQN